MWMSISEDLVLAELDRLIYPTFGESIVALGMVKSVILDEKGIQVNMIMNCPGCPAGQVTLSHVHRALRKLLESADQEVIVSLLPQVWTLEDWGNGP